MKTQQFWNRLAFDLVAGTPSTPHHDFAVPKSLTRSLIVGSVAFEEAGKRRVTPRADRARARHGLAVSARVANGRETRPRLARFLPVQSGFPSPQNFRPQNHGAVFRAACNQIERKAIPKARLTGNGGSP